LLAERLEEQLHLLMIVGAARMLLRALLSEIHGGEIVVCGSKVSGSSSERSESERLKRTILQNLLQTLLHQSSTLLKHG
jgi:hypothetical protein